MQPVDEDRSRGRSRTSSAGTQSSRRYKFGCYIRHHEKALDLIFATAGCHCDDNGGARVSGACGHRSFWRFPSLPSSSFFFSPLPIEVRPLEICPLNPAKGSGERRELPSGVWGKAPAANDFGAF